MQVHSQHLYTCCVVSLYQYACCFLSLLTLKNPYLTKMVALHELNNRRLESKPVLSLQQT